MVMSLDELATVNRANSYQKKLIGLKATNSNFVETF